MVWRFLIVPGFSIMAIAASAVEDTVNRWTLSTRAGTATLAFIREPGRAPPIMFVCGTSQPGVALVLVLGNLAELGDRHLRIDLESGDASATVAGERSGDPSPAVGSILGEVSSDQMHQLLSFGSARMTWRVEADNGFRTTRESVVLPHPMSRYRHEFLRFCR